MPQPGVNNPGYLPYPTASAGYPPYPQSSFGSFPSYPGASGASNPPATGYPPYMPNPSGYNNFYGGVSVLICDKVMHNSVFIMNPNILQQSQNTSQDGTMTITEEHIKASLISAVEDKLRRRIQERVNQHHAEIETLNRTKHELLEGRAKINDIISKLEREEVCHFMRCRLNSI